MKRRLFLKNYFAALCATSAALVWLCGYSVSGGQALLITGIAAAVIFLPWHRCPTAERILWVISAAASFRLGVALIERTFSTLPSVGVWLGWGILLFLLVYIGSQSLRESAWLPGAAILIAILVTFFWSFLGFDGSIEWNFTPWYRVTGGAVMLTGCALSACEAEKRGAANKAGALTGIGLWGMTAFVPLIMWSRNALDLVSPALLSAWRRLTLLPCSDVWLSTLCAVIALWQCGTVVSMLMRIEK